MRDYINRNLKRFPPITASETRPTGYIGELSYTTIKTPRETKEFLSKVNTSWTTPPPSLTEFIKQEIPSALPLMEQFQSEIGVDLDTNPILDHNGNYSHSYVEWLESKINKMEEK